MQPSAVLRNAADHRVLMNVNVLPQRRAARQCDMVVNLAAGADHHMRSDDRIRPDRDVFANLGFGIDKGGGVETWFVLGGLIEKFDGVGKGEVRI